MRTCPVCSGPVEGRSDKKYCSTRCRLQYDWDKNRDKQLEQMRQYHYEHRDERLQYMKGKNGRYYVANAERIKTQVRKYQRDNPEEWMKRGRVLRQGRRRARMEEAPVVVFTDEQLQQRLSMWAGCWICGEPPNQIDHVKPIAKGGAHILANLRPICGPCNQSKSDKWPIAA